MYFTALYMTNMKWTPLCTTGPTSKCSFWDKCSLSLWSTVNSRKQMSKILGWADTRHPHSQFMEHTNIFRYLRFRASLSQINCGPVVHQSKWPFRFMHNWTNSHFNKYKYMEKIYYDKHITDSLRRLWIYSEVSIIKIRVTFYSLCVITGTARMMGKIMVWVGPFVHKF